MWDHIYEDDKIKIRVEVHKRAKLRNDFMATSNFQDYNFEIGHYFDGLFICTFNWLTN